VIYVKTTKITENTKIHGISRNFIIFPENQKFCGISGKCKKNSGRATVLGKSAQMLKNLRKYIPSGGVDSRRECRILSKSQEIANSANFGEFS